MIRTVRKTMTAIMKDQVLDDERLETIFCEVESIINSRPLTPVSDDPKDEGPLTPNHLLLLRPVPTLSPGPFTKTDIYGRRWRHVQYVADCFWKRWLTEYLPLLQQRQRWRDQERNIAVDDVVLIQDENSPRKAWPLGRVIETKVSADGLVRLATVKTRWTTLTRPIHKLVLLEGCEESLN